MPVTPTMPAPIRLQAILDELHIATADEILYLNWHSGELQLLSEFSLAGLCDADEKAMPQKDQVFINRVRHILGSDEWIPLPGLVHNRDLAALRVFIESLEDDNPRKARLRSLLKSGFAQPVLDYLEEEEIEPDWHYFRKRYFYQQLQECLAKNGAALIDIENP